MLRFSVARSQRRLTIVSIVVATASMACWNQQAFAADTLGSLMKPDFVDLEACAVFQDGAATPATQEQIDVVLGLVTRADNGWSPPGRKEAEPVKLTQYRLGYKKPLPIGSLMISGTPRQVAFLKPGAPYPGDVSKPEHWQTVEVPSLQPEVAIAAFPGGVETRALLFAVNKPNAGGTVLRKVRPMGARLHSVTSQAVAHADAQYTAFSSAGPPFTYTPSLVVTGAGEWRNVGKNPMGQITRPPINEIYPSWFVLSWRDPQELSGLLLQDTIRDCEVQYFTGPDQVAPRAGMEKEWKTIKTAKQAYLAHPHMGLHTVEFDPVKTRGLRIKILKSQEGQIVRIQACHALINLGQRPTPKVEVAGAQQAAPFRIPVTLPGDGFLSVAIDTPDGHRVRNLVTREKLKAGTHQIAWDLRDESGTGVAPGKYHWKALYHPGLQLRYEMTPYPNISMISPQNPPWITNMAGPGGWMADHSPPRCAAVAGDRVYLGSPVSESGVSLIECDLNGARLWAHPSFAGFTGAWLLAADDQFVYVAANAGNTAAQWGVDASTEALWTVNRKTKEVKDLARLEPTESRGRGFQGMAAHDGKVFISVKADDRWLTNAAGLANVDFDHSMPRYRLKRKEHYAYEIVPDPQGDFARLFRLTSNPPGGAAGGKGGLTWIGSESSIGSRAYTVLAFNKPVELGSVVFPVPQSDQYKVKLSVLKPGAPYPPDPTKNDHWQDFTTHGTAAWDVALAPENTQTRALRIMFYQGDDDLLANINEDEATLNSDDAADGTKKESGFGETRWTGRLEGMKLLRRRFENVGGKANVLVNSGKVAADGTWDAKRSTPLSESDPGVYVMQWDQPQSLRGLAIKEIDGKLTKIDVHTGKANGKLDIAGSDGWQQVAQYEQERRDHHSGFPSYNGMARYVDGYVDFGKTVETTAVRLRVVQQWADNLPDSRGIRDDLGGMKLDPARCRIFGVAALKYVGGEPKIDSRGSHRIEVLDAKSGKIASEVAIDSPGDIATDAKGQLYAISGTQVVKVDLQGGDHQPLITDLEQPGALAVDKLGNIYVFEHAAKHQNIKVYDPRGKRLREIGTPGGYKVGPWDPTRMGNVTDLAIDEQDQIWVVADNYFPKRITVWSTAGKFKKELLGNTAYGGGGTLDPYDKSKLYYGPLEFELDWKTGKSYLKNLLTTEFLFRLVPVRIEDRTYMVSGPDFCTQPCGVVYRYLKDRVKMAAAVGSAGSFPPLAQPAIHEALGSIALKDHKFMWSDMNDDGEVQADEVKVSKSVPGMGNTTNFNRDLSISAGQVVYEVDKYLPTGVPVYRETQTKVDAGRVLRTNDGNFLAFGGGDREPERLVTPQGETLWSYASEGESTHGLTRAKPYSSAQIVGHFGWCGHETAHAGDLGEFVVMHGNTGTWHILTADGLVAGRIFEDMRTGSPGWSMDEHDRGLVLDEINVGQEHFSGYFCKTSDNKYYAIAGHNHVSIVEVLGIDKFKRLGGDLAITPQQLQQNELADQVRQKELAFEQAPVIDCYRLRKAPQIDGKGGDWEGAVSAEFGERDGITQNIVSGAQFRIGYTDTHLFVGYSGVAIGPLKNTGEKFDYLFKTGAAVDLQLSTKASAPDDRQGPVEGDLRLLMTYVNDKPRVVLYRAVVPNTPPAKAWHAASPTGRVSFDEVVELKDVVVAASRSDNGYFLEASIPLETLGLTIVPGERLKIDWGVLQSGPGGNEVLRRLYWANKATAIVADIPSEARLHPDLWGYVLFHDQSGDKATEFLSTKDVNQSKKDDLVKELLDEDK